MFFQEIVLKCLSQINGVGTVEGNLIDDILGRDQSSNLKGVHIEQDSRNCSVAVRLEVNVVYGVPIPEKADEIQSRVAEDVARLTGLHVSCVHVAFKKMIHSSFNREPVVANQSLAYTPVLSAQEIEKRYTDEF